MASDSRSGSPLSVLSSDAFAVEADGSHPSAMPPAKRQKLGESSTDSLTPPKLRDDASISSDSSGDVPHSPTHLRSEEEEILEQVTVCRWAGCDAGDVTNMDKLVAHIHSEHVESRTKKYMCEWSDCPRKSMPHASAYALKAHVRSHTKEKPFYCELPECDRAFTRSDALQKHYRTVHETEALRPSDPIPKSMHIGNKPSRLKAIIAAPTVNSGGPITGKVNGAPNGGVGWTSCFPSELGFTVEEEARGTRELYRLLRRQVHWAEEEADSLRKSCEILEELRKKEWLDKEVLLDQVLKTEISWQERRKLVLSQQVDLPIPVTAKLERPVVTTFIPMTFDPTSPSPQHNTSQPEDQREEAELRASLHQA